MPKVLSKLTFLANKNKIWDQSTRYRQGLLITTSITESVGIGLGLALRLNRPLQPRSTIWHSDQSFSARSSTAESQQP